MSAKAEVAVARQSIRPEKAKTETRERGSALVRVAVQGGRCRMREPAKAPDPRRPRAWRVEAEPSARAARIGEGEDRVGLVAGGRQARQQRAAGGGQGCAAASGVVRDGRLRRHPRVVGRHDRIGEDRDAAETDAQRPATARRNAAQARPQKAPRRSRWLRPAVCRGPPRSSAV